MHGRAPHDHNPRLSHHPQRAEVLVEAARPLPGSVVASALITLVLIGSAILVVLSLMARSADASGTGGSWERFRGTGGCGVSAEGSHPAEWSADSENIAWKVEVPGGGWSSPIVVGDRIYVTTATHPEYSGPVGFKGGVARMRETGKKPSGDMTFWVLCLDLADGRVLWQRDVTKGEPPYGIHPSNTFATESPAVSGDRLFVYFGAVGTVHALDLSQEGRELWRTDVGAYPTSSGFGSGSSLETDGDRVYVQCDNDQTSFLVALSAESGKQLWKTDRPKGTSWSTPVVWPADNYRVIACGPDNVTAYERGSGDIAWQLRGIGMSFSASPVFDDDRIYFGNSGPMNRGPLIALASGAEGLMAFNEVPDALAWAERRAGPGLCSPVLHDGLLYVFASPGVVACHDADSGDQVWRERLPGSPSIVSSPWVSGGRLFAIDENGTTFVMQAGREFKLLGKNELPGLFWATPSLAGDALLLREAGALYCVRSAAAEASETAKQREI